MSNINSKLILSDLSMIPDFIMEEILDINKKSNFNLLSEDSDEYKSIEEIVNHQLKEEEQKKLSKEEFSILQKTLKKLKILKLEVNSKYIYLVEGTIIFYYDEIFNHLMKENKEINVIGHSNRLVTTHTLNGNEILIVHKSALKNLLEMNISDQSIIFSDKNDDLIKLSEDFVESTKMEQYIILYGLDIVCIENIFKFIFDNINLSNESRFYYYLLMISPYYVSAIAYYDRECYISREIAEDNIYDLILGIILRIELRDYINNKTLLLDHLYNKLAKVREEITVEDFEIFNFSDYLKKNKTNKNFFS